MPHHPKVKSFNPATATGTRKEKMAFPSDMAFGGSTVVEDSPHQLKVEVVSPVAAADIGREKMAN